MIAGEPAQNSDQKYVYEEVFCQFDFNHFPFAISLSDFSFEFIFHFGCFKKNHTLTWIWMIVFWFVWLWRLVLGFCVVVNVSNFIHSFIIECLPLVDGAETSIISTFFTSIWSRWLIWGKWIDVKQFRGFIRGWLLMGTLPFWFLVF